MAGTDTERAGWARRLTRDCWQYRKDVLLALGSSLAGMAVLALVPLVPKLIIDEVIVRHERALGPWAALLVAAAVVVYVLTYIRRFYGGRLRPGRPARSADPDVRRDRPARRPSGRTS